MKLKVKIILFILLNLLFTVSIHANKFEPKESDLLLISDESDDRFTYIEYYDNNEKKHESHYKDGVPDGEQINWDENGNVISKEKFKNGTGIEKIYNNEGLLSQETKYVDGLVVKLTEYYENGKKNIESNYKNGKLDGNYTIWNKGGKVIYKTVFKNDTGKVKVIYEDEEKGSFEQEYSLKDGRVNGEYKTIENGKIISIENYKDGELDGVQSEYYYNGNKLSKKTYKDGTLDGDFIVWDKDGGIIYNTVFKDGTGLEKLYDRSGSILLESEMVKGLYDGEMKLYNEDGSIRSKTTSKSGISNGSHILYFPNGKMLSEMNYKDGVLDGKYAVWNKEGKKLYETNFVNGKGVMKNYDENGEIFLEIKYDTGGSILETKTKNNDITYKNGQIEGKNTVFFLNGKKSYEANYKDGVLTGKYRAWNPNGDLFYETEFINGVGVMKYYQEPDTLWVNKMGNGVMDIKSYIDKRFQMIMIEN
ncbi:MAG: hypothetical protein KBF12_12220 [Sebaldella sp.]|nr:hypothetical protein [Sebaldella sp.]